MNKRKFYLNSIYSRIFLTFLAVMIPIYITGVFIYNWGMTSVKNEIRNSSQVRITYLKDNLESEIHRINQIQLDYIYNKELNRFINEYYYLPVYDMYFMINDIQERLEVIKNSSNYISNVTVYFPDMGRSISSYHGLGQLKPEEYGKILGSYTSSAFPLTIDGEKMSINLVYPFPNADMGIKPLFAIEVQLSNEAISEYLTLLSDSKESSTVLFELNGGKLLTGKIANKSINKIDKLEQLNIRLGESGNNVIEVSARRYLSVYSYSKYLQLTVVQLIPIEEVFREPESYKFIFWIFSAVSFLIIVLYSLSTYRFIHKPLKIIVNAFELLKNQDFRVRLSNKSHNEFGYMFESFNDLAERLNELINRVYKEELYAKNAELKQLQSQINPHFLYNSFFILHRTIKYREFEEALQLSKYLGSFFQYITRSTSLDEVKLCQEVEHIRNYAMIQCFRFHGRLTVEFGVLEEKYGNIMVPRLVLQPLLENAIEHGMRETLGGGIIRIGFAGDGLYLNIFVEDNGNNLRDADLHELQMKLASTGDETLCTGIVNVHRRIQLKFGCESGISISRSELGGLRIEIKIKYEFVQGEKHV